MTWPHVMQQHNLSLGYSFANGIWWPEAFGEPAGLSPRRRFDPWLRCCLFWVSCLASESFQRISRAFRYFFPRGVTPRSHTRDRALSAELAKRARNRGATDGWQRTLQIGIAESSRQPLDCIANHVPLRAAARGRDADTLLELPVRLHE